MAICWPIAPWRSARLLAYSSWRSTPVVRVELEHGSYAGFCAGLDQRAKPHRVPPCWCTVLGVRPQCIADFGREQRGQPREENHTCIRICAHPQQPLVHPEVPRRAGLAPAQPVVRAERRLRFCAPQAVADTAVSRARKCNLSIEPLRFYEAGSEPPAGLVAEGPMPAAEIVSDGISVRAETTSRQPATHRASGPFGRKWDSCGLPVRFSETTAYGVPALLGVPGAPPCRLSAVLSAALDTAAVAVDRVMHIEGDRFL